jgi:hypothetical protein
VGSSAGTIASGVWGFVSASGPLVILKLTEEAAGAVDKVADAIRKVRSGCLVPLEITCPDGKTKISVSVREKDESKKVREFLRDCKRISHG